MNYINTTTGEYPVTESMIRLAHPNTSFPVPFKAPEEYALVFASPHPTHNPVTEVVRELAPALTDKGHWEQRWEVVPRFESAQEADAAVAEDVAAKRAAAWDRIKTERDRRKYLGVKVGQHWFHSDDPSRIQQLALAVMGAAIPAGLQWKTLTLTPPPVFVEMTPALAQSIFQATAASDAAIFAASEAHRVAMEASDSPESYDCSGGWPASIEDGEGA